MSTPLRWVAQKFWFVQQENLNKRTENILGILARPQGRKDTYGLCTSVVREALELRRDVKVVTPAKLLRDSWEVSSARRPENKTLCPVSLDSRMARRHYGIITTEVKWHRRTKNELDCELRAWFEDFSRNVA